MNLRVGAVSILFGICTLIFSGCGALATRPEKQMAYAESAFYAATSASADTLAPSIYQLARDSLLRARSAYRLKDFRSARLLATRSRLLSEEAEVKALRSEKNVDLISNEKK